VGRTGILFGDAPDDLKWGLGWTQIVFGALLVAALLFLSVFYAWRQLRLLAQLRRQPDLPSEEGRHNRNQAVRRLVSSGLLLVLAGLLTFILIYLEPRAQRYVNQIDATPAGETHQPTSYDRGLARIYGGHLIAFLLVLMAVVLLAGYDLWATRRYGLRQYRKIQDDRRLMIKRQLNRLREEGNGHH
jgi:hypothetical protein